MSWALEAQDYPDFFLAEFNKKRAVASLVEGELEISDDYKKAAIKIYLENDDLENWIHLHRLLGKEWRKQEQYEMAFQLFETAANKSWRIPETPKEYKQLAWVYADIGYTHKQLNNLKAITKAYEKALTIFEEKLEGEEVTVAKYIYSELGNAYSRLRDYQKAAFYHNRRKNILLKAAMWTDAAPAFNDLAMVFFNKEDYPQAIDHFLEGLNLEDTYFEDKATLLFNLADAYFQNGENAKAFFYNDECRKVIETEEIPLDEKAEFQIWVNVNYGNFYRAAGDFQRTELFFTQAIELVENTDLGNHRLQSALLIFRADLYLDWDKTDKALSDYYSALTHLLPNFKNNSGNLPTEDQLVAEPNLIENFGGMAKSLIKLFEQSDKPEYAKKAMQCFKLAGMVEKELLQLYILEGSKFSARGEHRWIKEAALSFTYDFWSQKKSKELEAEMFSLSEQSRGVLLLEKMVVETGIENEKTDSLRRRYFELNQSIQNLEQIIHELSNTTEGRKDSLQMQLLKTKESRADLLQQIGLDVSAVNWETNGIRLLDEVQQNLGADQVMIEYFLGENYLYIFRVTKENFLPIRKKLPPDLLETIDQLREGLTTQNHNIDRFLLFKKSATRLYDDLLKEVLENLPKEKNRLVIIPDGQLGFISFDLLLSSQMPQGENYDDLHYLVKDFSIAYAPSANLLLHQQKKEPRRAPRQFAGFAPSYDLQKVSPADSAEQQLIAQRGEKAFELKGAAEEVSIVCKILGGEKFTDEFANESVFKNKAKHFQVILLSMHSLVNISAPNFTKLLFTKGASKGLEDDNLYALELSGMQLQADLVVLSACNTGYGKLEPGEGVMSLSRSFFAAGVPSTVMSLWKVPDVQTKEIMVAFFSNLKKGMSKDKALQQAKINYFENTITSPSEADPYFWAGFIPAGNMQSLDLQTSVPLFWILGVGFFFLGLFFYFKRRL